MPGLDARSRNLSLSCSPRFLERTDEAVARTFVRAALSPLSGWEQQALSPAPFDEGTLQKSLWEGQETGREFFTIEAEHSA